MEKKEDELKVEDPKTEKLRERIADLHHSLRAQQAIRSPPSAISEETERDVVSGETVEASRFKIPSRVKIPPRVLSQSCSNHENQNVSHLKRMPGQPIRRRYHPRLERIVESVEVVC